MTTPDDSNITGIYKGGTYDGLTVQLIEIVDHLKATDTGELYDIERDESGTPMKDHLGRYRYCIRW